MRDLRGGVAVMGVLVVGGPRPLAAAFPLTLALSHEGRGDAIPPAPPWERGLLL